MAIPYNNYEYELDCIKQRLHDARDAREYEYYVRMYDAMQRNVVNSLQNYGNMVQNQMMQGVASYTPGVPKMSEPVTPLSFLKNADKKLLLTGVLA